MTRVHESGNPWPQSFNENHLYIRITWDRQRESYSLQVLMFFFCAAWTATTTVLITRHGCYQFGSLLHCLFVQCGLPVWGHCPASPQFWSSRHCGGRVGGHTFHLLPSWSAPLPGAGHFWDQRPLQADCGVHRHRLRSEGQMHDGMVRVRFGRLGQCWVVWGCEAWWSRVWVEVSCCRV